MSKEGLETMILYFMVANFSCATGIILLENKKAMQLIKNVTISNGRMKRNSGMPADLIATISKVSPRLPNVMMEESNSAMGNAKGITLAATYKISCRMVNISSPFPTKSSMYSQKNCMIKMNIAMRKVARKGPMKAFMINMSNFFITCY